MWKAVEVALNPGRYLSKYGARDFAARAASYPLRPLFRATDRRKAEADERYWRQVSAAHPGPHPAIAIYPETTLHPGYALTKLLAILGARAAPPESAHVTILWEDATYVATEPPPCRRVLNAACRDISKAHVARVFAEAFGYALEVDPASFQGPMVEKSDANGLHDGRIVTGPLSPKPGCVYQRVVDNREGGDVVDLRTPVVGDTIPFVYLKYRPQHSRFSNTNTRTERRETVDVFSPSEVRQIIAFARRLGLDLGEIDVLRDGTDKRLYIVDVAKTPFGPPNHLPRDAGRRAMNDLAAAFAREFLS